MTGDAREMRAADEPTTDVRFQLLAQTGWDEAADAFAAGYAGYLVPIALSADDLQKRCVVEDVSPDASFVIKAGDTPIGILLVGVRGARARLNALGIARNARARGLGFRALQHAMASVPGIRRWELEVFAQNATAVHLYERCGFTADDRLYGYERPASADDGGGPSGTMATVSMWTLADRMADDDLPWQLDRRTLARLGAPWFGVHDGGDCYAAINPAPADALIVRWMFDRSRRASDEPLAALVRAIAATHAGGRPIRMVQVVPSSFDDRAHALGFARLPLHQLRMIRGTDAG